MAMIRVVLEDRAGRRVHVIVDGDKKYVAAPVGNIGVILFQKSADSWGIDKLPIYRQVLTESEPDIVSAAKGSV